MAQPNLGRDSGYNNAERSSTNMAIGIILALVVVLGIAFFMMNYDDTANTDATAANQMSTTAPAAGDTAPATTPDTTPSAPGGGY